ncbi:MAG: Minf_1886 family protein [Pirellulaceae bacterium]
MAHVKKTKSQEIPPLVKLLCEDRRYKLEAYQFVRLALNYAQEVLGLGGGPAEETPDDEDQPRPLRHITGQNLSHACKQLAHDQYGLMARLVLNGWGIRSTSDFGEIVYNLIKIGEMTRSPGDLREDFDNVYDFDAALAGDFAITKEG